KGKKGDAKASENPGDRASRREGKSCDGKCEGNINEGKSCNGKTSEGKRSIARKIILILVVIVAFLGIQLLRKSVIGTFVPSGTGGSDLRADFSKKRFVLNVLTQIAYLLGFNLGPDFMCGLTWKMTSWPIKVTVVISAAMLLTLLFNYLKSRPVWREFVYFAGFIIGMVTASSVSIRVEMRWVLGSFMVLTALIAVVARHVSKMELAKGPERGFYDEAGDRVAAYIAKYVGSGLILACLASVLIIIINCYYMANMDEMYLRQDQRRHESFIERTYGTYGDDVLDMDVYILVNYFELTEFEERNFNKPMKLFDGELNVYHVDGPDSVPADGRKKVVLYEDPETDSYLEAAMPPEILGR
ncbi:MAG: hypothetical protein Q4B67_07395, partial [Eubacteriales bacterium]|nr:hypothetical protein [Eubacteriales bacterium]